jgi:hypothetical protein
MSRKNFENEEAVLTYKGDFNTESLIEFINSNKLRSYGRLTQEDRSIVQAFFETKRAYKTVICVSDGDAQQLSVAAATPAALKAIGQDNVFVGIVGSEFSAALNHFGVEESELPVVIVQGNVDADDKRKFKSSLAAFTAAEIAQFVKEAADGKAVPWVKSEPIPSSNDAPVKILTGHTVADIVLDNTKDVLVEVKPFSASHQVYTLTIAPRYTRRGAATASLSSPSTKVWRWPSPTNRVSSSPNSTALRTTSACTPCRASPLFSFSPRILRPLAPSKAATRDR